jgi:hypothetical protein
LGLRGTAARTHVVANINAAERAVPVTPADIVLRRTDTQCADPLMKRMKTLVLG